MKEGREAHINRENEGKGRREEGGKEGEEEY